MTFSISRLASSGLAAAAVAVSLFSSSAAADVGAGFAESFEATALPAGWSTWPTADAGWQVTALDATAGTQSLRSAAIDHSETAAIEWTETFAVSGVLSFDVRVSAAQSCCDRLSVYLDDVLQYRVSDTGTAWESHSVNIAPGVHTVQFRYVKSSSIVAGEDAAFIDKLTYTEVPDLASVTGNILVVRGNKLYELASDGTQLQVVAIPSANSPRDVEILEDNRIAIYDAPHLRVYDPANGSWESSYVEGWYSPYYANNTSHLELTGDYLYATDHATGAGTPRVVQFSLADLSGRFVETTHAYIDLTYGRDDVFYGLYTTNGDYDVLDPETLSVLDGGLYGAGFASASLAVNAAGEKFSAASIRGSGALLKFDASDTLLKAFFVGSIGGNDIDIGADGNIVIGGTQVALTDDRLNAVQLVNPGGGATLAYVRIVEPALDTDGDGMPDRWELRFGLNPNSAADADGDLDGEGLSNLEEFRNFTNPLEWDSDKDWLSDYYELNTSGTAPRRADSDDDGLSDFEEVGVYFTDPNVVDTDEDELTDYDEVKIHGTNPLRGDTDGDQMPDKWELDNGLDPTAAADAAEDADTDGLTNREEFAQTTGPNNPDSDNDGVLDGAEVKTYASDPLNRDTDGDLLDDGQEVAAGLDPAVGGDADADLDGDRFSNIAELLGGSDINDADSYPVAGSWAMEQGDARHTSYLPLALDASDFSERWAATIGSYNSWNQPVTVKGRVYISSGEEYPGATYLKALDASDGEERWSTVLASVAANNLPRIRYTSAPSLGNGKVYLHTAGNEDTAFWGFDQLTGEQLFRTQRNRSGGSRSGAPTVVGDRVFFNPSHNNYTVGFDALSGANLWEVSNADTQYYWDPAWEPAFDGEFLYVPDQYELRGINPDTGAIEFALSSDVSLRAAHSPVLGSNHNVIVGSYGLISFDIENRRVNWSLNDGDSFGAPAVALGRIFVIHEGELQVYAEATGEFLWSWATPAADALEPFIALSATHAFVSTYTATYAIDLATQASVWTYAMGGRVSLSNEGALLIAQTNSIAVIDIEGDSDSDGLPNWWERLYGMNPDVATDASDDADGDLLSALEEFNRGTYPDDADSDNDGLSDGAEVNVYLTEPRDQDTDGDGLTDGDEVLVHLTDPNNTDSDDDLLTDGDEINVHGSNPNETDTDGDQMDDFWEVDNALNPSDPADASADRDTDGLTELEEYFGLTDPLHEDTDRDGLLDGEEVNAYATNPLAGDTDGDHLIDSVEVDAGFDPLDPSDGSGDNDLDGYNNRVELFAGTDPDFSLSRPEPADWVSLQANASHDGANPILVNVDEISVKWQTIVNPDEDDISVGKYGLDQVTAADGRIFVTDNAYLWYGVQMWTLNEADGSVLWSKTFDDARRANPAAYIDGKLYMTINNERYITYYDKWFEGFLRTFDAATGSPLDSSAAFGSDDNALPAPTPYGDNVYITGTWNLNAFAPDGLFQWQNSAGYPREGTPAVTENYVIASGAFGQLAAYDRLTGAWLHDVSVPDLSSPAGYYGFYANPPVLGDYTNVLVAGYGGVLASFNYAQPEPQWLLSEDGSFGTPSAAHGLLFVLNAGVLQARNQFDGSLAWTWMPADGAAVNRAIAVTANYVFVSGPDVTYAINIETAALDWSWPVGGDLTITRAGTLLIADDTGVLTAFDLTGDSDGDQLPDSWEILHGLDPANPDDADTDLDSDMLTNREEFNLGTNPTLRDTDADWLPDNYEWQAGLDPLDRTDSWQDPDGDLTVSFFEYVIGTDPLVAESRLTIWRAMWDYLQQR